MTPLTCCQAARTVVLDRTEAPVTYHTTYILGAPDPEMATIEGLLRECGQRFLYAGVRTPAGAARVTPREAYRAEVLLDPKTGVAASHSNGITLVLVECDGPAAAGLEVVARCDHHRPGDAGFGRPPAEFMSASSLGQVISHLARAPGSEATPLGLWRSARLRQGPGHSGLPVYEAGGWYVPIRGVVGYARWVRIPTPLARVAAADHCLAAAYAGQCPGVGPAELADHRARQRAEWLVLGPGQGRDEPRAAVALAGGPRFGVKAALARLDAIGVDAWYAAVQAAYHKTEESLRSAPVIQLRLDDDPAGEVLDLRATGTLPELPEVLGQTGQCALYRMVPPAGSRDPRPKVGIIGAGEGSVPGTAPVEAFLGGWAAAHGLVGIYPEHDGSPDGIRAAAARGYAGGYEQLEARHPEESWAECERHAKAMLEGMPAPAAPPHAPKGAAPESEQFDLFDEPV